MFAKSYTSLVDIIAYIYRKNIEYKEKIDHKRKCTSLYKLFIPIRSHGMEDYVF